MREHSQTCSACGALVPAPVPPPGVVLNPIPACYCSACGAALNDQQQPNPQSSREPESIAGGAGEPIYLATPRMPAYPGYIERQLRPDEQVRYRTRQHPARLARGVLMGLLAAAALAYFGLAAPTGMLLDLWFGPTQAALVWGAALVFGCGLILIGVLSSLVGLSATELAVTDQRILGRVGGIIQRRVDIPLKDIAALSTNGKALSLLGHGSVAVLTIGHGAREFNFIPDPFKFCQALLEFFPGEAVKHSVMSSR
jgi:hypothetical protein